MAARMGECPTDVTYRTCQCQVIPDAPPTHIKMQYIPFVGDTPTCNTGFGGGTAWETGNGIWKQIERRNDGIGYVGRSAGPQAACVHQDGARLAGDGAGRSEGAACMRLRARPERIGDLAVARAGLARAASVQQESGAGSRVSGAPVVSNPSSHAATLRERANCCQVIAFNLPPVIDSSWCCRGNGTTSLQSYMDDCAQPIASANFVIDPKKSIASCFFISQIIGLPKIIATIFSGIPMAGNPSIRP